MVKNNRKFLLEIGQRFGRLEVIQHAGKNHRHENLWLMKCDCGTEKILATGKLTSQGVKSCGCLRVEKCKERKIDLTGQKFGMITVIKVSYKKRKYGSYLWECRCDCGNIIYTDITSLKNGNTTSCGCKRRKLPYGYPAFNRVVRTYKRHAKKNNRVWELTKEQAKVLFESGCYYCGEPPSNITKYHNTEGTFVYNGIDRLNSDEGYTIKNSVPCCIKCNRAKHTMSKDEFLQHIMKIYNNIIHPA